MPKGLFLSLLLHSGIIAVAYYGVPILRKPPEILETPIVVEVVTVADKTNPPPMAKPKPEPKPKPEKHKKARPSPPEPEPQKAEPPKPKPKPEPTEPDVAAVPLPESKPKPKPPPKLTNKKPKRKPRPPDRFASLLKNIDQDLDKSAPAPRKKKKEKNEEDTFKKLMEKAMMSIPAQRISTEPITISVIDLVRKQIEACWNIPVGAKDAENLIIEVKVFMNPDGTVRQARIKNKMRMQTDKFFRVAAESAKRAVLNRRCQPFKLPQKKYEQWQEMTLTFNPKEML